VLAQLRDFVGPGSPAGFDLNPHIAAGEIGLILEIDGYNGQPDDSDLLVAAYASTGTWTADDAGGAGVIRPPRWDGNDVWAPDPASVQPGTPDLPRFTARQAYVTGGTLVASFDRIQVPASIGVGSGPFEADSAIVTANVVAAGASFALTNGVVGARVATQTLLSGLARFRDPYAPDSGGPGALCGANVDYNLVKSTVCVSADLNADPAHDNLGFACNALSAGVTFTAQPAKLGPEHAPAVAPLNGCAAPDGAPWSDDCARDNGDY